MMTSFRLLLDEMISPAIVAPLWMAGIDAVALRDRGLLEIEDHVVWRLAQSEARTIGTANGKDFMKFAARSDRHAGLLIIPGGGSRAEQLTYIANAADSASRRSDHAPNFENVVVTVDENHATVWNEVSKVNPQGTRPSIRRRPVI
jgi:predicted nuclease of predicted toxin-antitoxin system